jgi:hypothetical protein
MPFAHFHELFPEVAREETRSLVLVNSDVGLHRGTYMLAEMFCNEAGCDCRRALLQVWTDGGLAGGAVDLAATVSFAWEPEAFYRKWASFPLSKDDVAELTGPALQRMAPQSDMAEELLPLVRAALRDRDYVERIVRHYAMYREVIDNRTPKEEPAVVRSAPKPRVNQPCPCGSGKNYKRCCLGKTG